MERKNLETGTFRAQFIAASCASGQTNPFKIIIAGTKQSQDGIKSSLPVFGGGKTRSFGFGGFTFFLGGFLGIRHFRSLNLC